MYGQYENLYKVSPSTGKLQVWFGWTEGNKVWCSWGEVDGKLQTKRYYAEGKNTGRSNETTPEQQALVELEAMYQSQVDNKHYKTSQIEAIESSQVCRIPRKVSNYKDRYGRMSDMLLTSIKLNGSRACVVDGKLYSKIGRHEDIKVEHLREAVALLGNISFDSEVYAHGLSLQRIRSAWLKPVKSDKEIIKIANERAKKVGQPTKFKKVVDAVEYLGYNPNEDALKLKLYIFDIPDDNGVEFKYRINIMSELEEVVGGLGLKECIDFLYPKQTFSHEERMQYLQEVHSQGYEGLVHYEPEGVYEYGKRSTNTCKSKPRLDGEAKVLSVEKDNNGEGVLTCITSDELDNVQFKCKMKVERRDGNRYERDYHTMLDLVGKWITFSYEELSDSGIPTKGIGECLRNCDEYGSPLE
jgi:DNA ligase 1